MFFKTIFAWWYKDPDPYLWLMPDPVGKKTWIRILRIRIRNTGFIYSMNCRISDADPLLLVMDSDPSINKQEN